MLKQLIMLKQKQSHLNSDC